MNPREVTRVSLSPGRRRLVDLMQQVGFGRIDGLIVQGGEPVFVPATKVVRQIKLASDQGPRAGGERDFVLKAQVLDLFAQFDELGDGRVEELEIKHGLPFRMNMETPAGVVA